MTGMMTSSQQKQLPLQLFVAISGMRRSDYNDTEPVVPDDISTLSVPVPGQRRITVYYLQRHSKRCRYALSVTSTLITDDRYRYTFQVQHHHRFHHLITCSRQLLTLHVVDLLL